MKISKEAYDLIIEYEVTSKEYYEKHYQKPEWPGLNSGPTVGIGYDLGMTDKKTIESDWKGIVPDDMLKVMLSCIGIHGLPAKELTRSIKNKINITWEQATTVHKNKTIPLWENKLLKHLPNADKLNPNQFGAMVSLIYNRGTGGFTNGKPKYKEMGEIRVAMIVQEFEKIPGYLRSMKRLWPNTKGLLRRREAEAILFETPFIIEKQ